jgi:DNA-binding transcriptional LysR family regulator
MEPTPHAYELMPLLRQAENTLQMALDHHVVFDPGTSSRVFHVSATDIGQVRLLPPLMKRIREIAPGVRVDFRTISEETPKMLEAGQTDVAVGFIPTMGAGFCQQKLFKERFVCAARADHPRVRDQLTSAQFQNELHLAVSIRGTGHSVVDKLLAASKITRQIGLRVPSFLGVANIIMSTDMLVIVPEQLGLIFARNGGIRLFKLPFAAPAYLIRQHWHERYSRDPSNKWLRGVIAQIMSR